jgi:BNR/Asp-box repeat
MLEKILLLTSLLVGSFNVSGQWVNANPGAGGQIQHLTCHPTIPGRMYFASDVEGFYQSDDFGKNWHFRGRTTRAHDVYAIQAEPNNPNRIYAGFSLGFALSDDNGETWQNITLPTASPQMSVATIAVDPKNPENVYVANSWLEDNPVPITFDTRSGESEPAVVRNGGVLGTRKLWYSHDRGKTWHVSYYYPKNTTGDRNVYTIALHPTLANRLVIANDSGLVESRNGGKSWSPLPRPNRTLECQGGEFSPDGKWLYAVFRKVTSTGIRSGLYARTYPVGEWQEIHNSPDNPMFTAPNSLWRPVVQQGTTPGEHYVLMGGLPRGGAVGLFEASITTSEAGATGRVSQILHYTLRTEVPFDIGWNAYNIYSRTYCYYPPAWKTNPDGFSRGVLAMAQQTIFVGDAARPTDSWRVATSRYVRSLKDKAGNDIWQYRTTGTASTVNWDVAGHKNYVMQAMGDNSIVESYDGGQSWYMNMPPLPSIQGNCDAAQVAQLSVPTVLASTQTGYGGALNFGTGMLRYKRLTNLNGPTDPWVTLIDGVGTGNVPATAADLKGLSPTNSRIVYIALDPANPRRVYVACAAGSSSTAPHNVLNGGVYVCDDIEALINEPTNPAHYFRNIGAGGPGTRNTRKILVDAINPNVVYTRSLAGLHKGERQPDGSYRWSQLRIDGTADGLTASYQTLDDFTTWRDGNTAYLAVTRASRQGTPHHELWLSTDAGRSFNAILNRAEAFGVRPPAGNWYTDELPVSLGGLAGIGNTLITGVFVRRPLRDGGPAKGISMLRGTIQPNGSVKWVDWTGTPGNINSGELEFPVLRSGKIWLDERGKPQMWVATHGNGSWKRAIEP